MIARMTHAVTLDVMRSISENGDFELFANAADSSQIDRLLAEGSAG
jgi:hypothetical protein